MSRYTYRTNYDLYSDLPQRRPAEIDMILAQSYPHMSHYFCSHCCYIPDDSHSSFVDACSFASHGSIDFSASRSGSVSELKWKLKCKFRRILCIT